MFDFENWKEPIFAGIMILCFLYLPGIVSVIRGAWKDRRKKISGKQKKVVDKYIKMW